MVAPLLHNHELPAEAVNNTDPPVQNVVEPPARIVAVGAGFTVTNVAADVVEQPDALVTVTEYEPFVVAVIACVVAPLLHNHELPADAVNSTDPPTQNVVGPPALMVAAGRVFTITSVSAEVEEQPDALVTVTEYKPLEFTVIDCVVAPLLHNHELPDDAVNTTDPPVQKVVGPLARIVAAGAALTVIE